MAGRKFAPPQPGTWLAWQGLLGVTVGVVGVPVGVRVGPPGVAVGVVAGQSAGSLMVSVMVWPGPPAVPCADWPAPHQTRPHSGACTPPGTPKRAPVAGPFTLANQPL